MTIDTNKLRMLAEAATPGSWSRAGGLGGSQLDSVRGGDRGLIVVAFGCNRTTDAAFIAAANPEAVLALLDELAATQGDLRAEREVVIPSLKRRVDTAVAWISALQRDLGDARCELAALAKERDALRAQLADAENWPKERM